MVEPSESLQLVFDKALKDAKWTLLKLDLTKSTKENEGYQKKYQL